MKRILSGCVFFDGYFPNSLYIDCPRNRLWK